MSGFRKATKTAARLRMALIGPAGSGKTYTGLTLACALGKRVAVIDTEHGSASKYADIFDFDVLELDSFAPQRYVEAVRDAAAAGYDCVLVDSLSHAWVGRGGALEMHDAAAAKQRGGNSFAAWREVTPHHNALVEAIVQAPLHVVATMRSKTEYVVEEGGRKVRKVGLAPVQRDGLEYEFDVVGDLSQDNTLVVTKTRCPALAGQVIAKPDKRLAETLSVWLGGAAPAPEAKKAVPPAPAQRDNETPAQAPAKAGKTPRVVQQVVEDDARLARLRLGKPGDLIRAIEREFEGKALGELAGADEVTRANNLRRTHVRQSIFNAVEAGFKKTGYSWADAPVLIQTAEGMDAKDFDDVLLERMLLALREKAKESKQGQPAGA